MRRLELVESASDVPTAIAQSDSAPPADFRKGLPRRWQMLPRLPGRNPRVALLPQGGETAYRLSDAPLRDWAIATYDVRLCLMEVER